VFFSLQVSVDGVLKTMKENANKAKSLLLTTIPQIGSMEWSETLRNLKVGALTSVSRLVLWLLTIVCLSFCLSLSIWSLSLCILCRPTLLFFQQAFLLSCAPDSFHRPGVVLTSWLRRLMSFLCASLVLSCFLFGRLVQAVGRPL
jgi:hypothetical protein